MKIGVVPVNLGEFTDPDVLTSFVRRAESLGYESVWTFEHVIVPGRYDSVYPYDPSGRTLRSWIGVSDEAIAIVGDADERP